MPQYKHLRTMSTLTAVRPQLQDQGLAPEERQASSLPHDSVTRDDLRQLVRQRSRSVSWSDQADARERVLEGRAPRRRRHLVYLGGGTGPTLDSIKPGEMDSVDEIIRRASIANSEVRVAADT